jgi:hypothetical protein
LRYKAKGNLLTSVTYSYEIWKSKKHDMKNSNQWLSRIARIGLSAKGFVYVLLGCLAFMAAFEIGGQGNSDANRSGVFNFVQDAPGGEWLLILLTAGLVCYSIWRIVEAFTSDRETKWYKRLRYIFSALAYLSVAYTAVRILLHTYKKGKDRNQDVAARLMESPYGPWLVGLFALVLAGVGCYQIWYGLSEKYKKHVSQLSSQGGNTALLYSGKIGYVARGIVWLVIAFLMLKAAWHANAAQAGGSVKAFQFIEQSRYGSYLLGIVGLGLIAYGFFNFVRARYENFDKT